MGWEGEGAKNFVDYNIFTKFGKFWGGGAVPRRLRPCYSILYEDLILTLRFQMILISISYKCYGLFYRTSRTVAISPTTVRQNAAQCDRATTRTTGSTVRHNSLSHCAAFCATFCRTVVCVVYKTSISATIIK